MAAENMREERDSMGSMQVPCAAYYGASTQRAVLNFPISDLRFSRTFIRALGLIKQYAAVVNKEFGDLDSKVADAVIKAAAEVVDGKLDSEFVVDIFQTGSGTSTNMNANEVIALPGRTLCWRAWAMPGLALPAAQPQTELTMTRTAPAVF